MWGPFKFTLWPWNKSKTNLGVLIIIQSQFTLQKLWSVSQKVGKAQRDHCSTTGNHGRLQKIWFGDKIPECLDDYKC